MFQGSWVTEVSPAGLGQPVVPPSAQGLLGIRSSPFELLYLFCKLFVLTLPEAPVAAEVHIVAVIVPTSPSRFTCRKGAAVLGVVARPRLGWGPPRGVA